MLNLYNNIRYVLITILFFVVLISFNGCKDEVTSQPQDDYSSLINQGWTKFKLYTYSTSLQYFSQALAKDSSKIEGYIGVGWCLMKLDSVSLSDQVFNYGSSKSSSNPDLFAGWSFALNALKQNSKSNQKIDMALNLSPNWKLPYDTSYNYIDLKILKAENYFLLGDFSNSLAVVKQLNPAFNADITTPQGILSLQNEIERLKNR